MDVHPHVEIPDFSRYHAKVCHNGKPGWPSFEIDLSQIDLLRDYHFNWQKISEILGMHRYTQVGMLGCNVIEVCMRRYA